MGAGDVGRPGDVQMGSTCNPRSNSSALKPYWMPLAPEMPTTRRRVVDWGIYFTPTRLRKRIWRELGRAIWPSRSNCERVRETVSMVKPR
jgi:hypothetical protein